MIIIRVLWQVQTLIWTWTSEFLRNRTGPEKSSYELNARQKLWMKSQLPLGKVCPSSLQWTIPTFRANDDCKNVWCCKLRSGFEWWCMIRIGFSPKLAKTDLKNSVEMISGSVAASVRINIASIVFFNDSLTTIWKSTDSKRHTFVLSRRKLSISFWDWFLLSDPRSGFVQSYYDVVGLRSDGSVRWYRDPFPIDDDIKST